MFRRLIVVAFFIAHAAPGSTDTNTAGWNCKQKEDSGEWLCVTGTEPSLTAKEPQPEEISKPTSLPAPENYGPFVPSPKPVPILPPTTVAQRPGWNCKASDNTGSWECSLMGTDPKGQLRAVEGDEKQARFLTAAFDFREEDRFKMMQTDLKFDPWASCQSPLRNDLDFSADEQLRAESPMDVQADYTEVFDKEITSFVGNVKIKRADQSVQAERATYDTVSETMDAQGNVYYREDEMSLYSDTALLNLATDQARLRDVLFIVPGERGRGKAKVVYRDSSDLSRYKDVAYTTCRPGNQDWIIHASRLKINRETGRASAKHAWMEFAGIPFLYSPYISFPIDDRRKSGFLSPSFGSSDENGFDFSLPYYWNIASNYDATIRPRGLSKRGFMLGGDLRYLTESSVGMISGEYLPYDSETKDTRGQFSWENRTTFAPGLKANVDVNYVSDDDYLDELGNTLSISNTRHILSRGDLTYNTQGISFLTRLENYQTIDSEITSDEKPYRRLPQIRLDLNKQLDLGFMPLELDAVNEFVYFYRGNGVRGQRLNFKPSISVPFQTASTFLTPKVAVQHTQYWLDNKDTSVSDSISRTLPIFSVDSGVFLERDLDLFGDDYVHTLEPRLYYLYTPHDNQDDIPDFDSSGYDFNFNSLFRDNRFSGSDRVQDANQISVALTSRLINSQTGLEPLKLDLGQIYYFRDREVTLPGESVETSSYSNLLAGLSGQLTRSVSVSSQIQWNPETSDIDRGEVFARYRSRQEQILNLSYRFRQEDTFEGAEGTSQSDISFLWPIVDNWNIVGRWMYSFEENLTVESFLGLEKESCCWRFRLLGRRYVNSAEDDPQTGIFVQLELKGLTGFGDKVEKFLEENISGYRIPEDR